MKCFRKGGSPFRVIRLIMVDQIDSYAYFLLKKIARNPVSIEIIIMVR